MTTEVFLYYTPLHQELCRQQQHFQQMNLTCDAECRSAVAGPQSWLSQQQEQLWSLVPTQIAGREASTARDNLELITL
eukprot:5178933-Amphidinium_carterae.1